MYDVFKTASMLLRDISTATAQHNNATLYTPQYATHALLTQLPPNMAISSNEVAPPSYHQLEQSEAASGIFLDRIQATIQAEQTLPTEKNPSKPTACATSSSTA
jgi:hypothetical protein